MGNKTALWDKLRIIKRSLMRKVSEMNTSTTTNGKKNFKGLKKTAILFSKLKNPAVSLMGEILDLPFL